MNEPTKPEPTAPAATTPSPTPTTTAPAPEKKPEAGRARLSKVMGYKEPVKAPEPPKTDTKPETPPQPQAQATITPTPEPAKKPEEKPRDQTGKFAPKKPRVAATTPPPPQAPIDYDRIGQSVGDAVAKATAKPIAQIALNDDEQEELSIIEWKASRGDKKFASAKDRFIANAEALRTYADNWQREHPSEQFNPDDSEHDGFFQSHQSGISARELKQAEREMIAAQAKEEVEKSLKPELEKFQRHQRAQELAPVIQRDKVNHDKQVLDMLDDPELRGIIGEDLAFNRDAYGKLDPVKRDVVFGELNRASAAIVDASRYLRGATDKPSHPETAAVLRDLEDQLRNKLDDSGKRTFMPVEKYRELEREYPPEEVAKQAWTLTPEVVSGTFAYLAATRAAEMIKNQENIVAEAIKARGYTKAEVPKAGPQPTTPGVTPPASIPASAHSPSSVASTIVTNPAGAQKSEQLPPRQVTLNRVMGYNSK